MSRPFQELVAKLSAERRARIAARSAQLIAEEKARQVSVSPENHEKRDTKTSHQGSSVHQSVGPDAGLKR